MKLESQQKLYDALDRVLDIISQDYLIAYITNIKSIAKNPIVRIAWDFLHASQVQIEYNRRFYEGKLEQIDCDGLTDSHVETALKYWLKSRGITALITGDLKK